MRAHADAEHDTENGANRGPQHVVVVSRTFLIVCDSCSTTQPTTTTNMNNFDESKKLNDGLVCGDLAPAPKWNRAAHGGSKAPLMVEKNGFFLSTRSVPC